MEIIGVHPGRKIIIFFLTTIILGTALLSLPVSSAKEPVSFVDALFTATSAVCVTGLIVKDTGTDFSLFGQIVILFLIQLGGLGILTFTSALVLSFVPRLNFKDRFVITHTLGTLPKVRPNTLIMGVLGTTLIIEGIGSVALFFCFRPYFPTGQAAYHAVFHAVSAFCNAGFSTFSNSLEGFNDNTWVIGVVSLLIILGGLGFITITELITYYRIRKRRLSLHTKLCLAMTGVLLLAGTFLFYVAEEPNALKDMNLIHGVANSFFQAVTCRTAGFNTLAQSNLTEVSLLLTMLLMFIGACPGSTGGGIKTTTFAVAVILAYRRFQGFKSVKIFKRSIHGDSINRAMTVIILSLAVILIAFVFLMFIEEKPLPHRLIHGWFVESLFEVISAFGTVGLSLGVTEKIFSGGKITIIILMFVGRVGLLTLVYNLVRPRVRGEVVYVEEQVMIG